MRIFRRDFRVTQFKKCIPVILKRSQEISLDVEGVRCRGSEFFDLAR